jgi:O-antigen/teichoic acid export membrane protein
MAGNTTREYGRGLDHLSMAAGTSFRGTGVRPLIKYAIHTYGNFVVSYFRKYTPNFLIGRYSGSQALGFTTEVSI